MLADSPFCPVLAFCLQRNAKFKHHGKDDFVLNVPEFTVKPGELVAIVGRVGAGKSSLVHAALGNMQPVQGTAEAGGRVSYVPQNPWCQNLSLRDNITFGMPFDEERYSRVSFDIWTCLGTKCCMGTFCMHGTADLLC
jgi:ABC-type bacteriocin/lantibiotic exporter with double-glycine peptidase domain